MTYELTHEAKPLEKYNVTFEKSVYATVEVMAESREDAVKAAFKMESQATYEDGLYYDPEVISIDKVA